MHEAGRVARLHTETPVFVLTGAGDGEDAAAFDRLHPFHRALLTGGEVPEDIWTRVARHWHECFRLRHPVTPGDPRAANRCPWEELDHFIREDNILQLRSVMAAVAARGRVWTPIRAVAQGSFIELTGRDLEAVAIAEHTRWFRRRQAAGWSPSAEGARVNANVVPWAELPDDRRAVVHDYLRSQLTQLEDMGLIPVVPAGGPPEAAEFQRTGDVWASKLSAPRRWVRRSGDELHGRDGDWRVVDSHGEERTVGDMEFRASHEPIGGERWRRIGRFIAWQVSEGLVIRTKEGRATAHAGDWVVEGIGGERWPVSDDQFQRTYHRPS
jgi:hypothetical protein